MQLSFNPQSFADRQTTSTNARKALLERFKARPKADDPVMLQRRAEREGFARARAEREVEKAKIRAEAERLAAIEQERIAEQEREEERAREAAIAAEQARIQAERPRKVLLEAVSYMQMRSSRNRR